MNTAVNRSATRPSFAGSRIPRLAAVPAFVDRVATDWAPTREVPVLVEGTARAAASHRARLAEQMRGRTMVIGAGAAPTRNDDCQYRFRPDSDFVWLTGCQAEGAYLVLSASADGSGDHDATLYLPRPLVPGEQGFFSSPAHGELWVGPAVRLGDWEEALGIAVRDISELEPALSGTRDALASRSVDPDLVSAHGLDRSERLRETLALLRKVKDAWEVAQLRDAVDQTERGFAATVRELPRAIGEDLGERWLQGTFDRHARAFGNGPGYASIVGSGAHAPILHWVRCDGRVAPDDAVLLDMGVEATSLYTADVTRTVPASGAFSAAHRCVYEVVERAHRAAIGVVGPGVEYSDFHFAAMEQLALGLSDLGMLPVSVDEALSPAGQHHRRYIVCGIGHHLGLDVHDCRAASYEQYEGAPFEPGNVFTIEPGLYFHSNDLSVPPELRGVGIRIEDDLLITAGGVEVLSGGIPFDLEGIQSWTSEQMAPANE